MTSGTILPFSFTNLQPPAFALPLQYPCVIEIEDLHVTFNGSPVLRGVNGRVEKGQVAVIVGPSGGGKSTLLKTLIRFIRPQRGVVRVGGTDITGLNERALRPIRRNIGMVFQHAALFDSMTVEENIRFPLHHHGRLGRREKDRKVHALLDELELAQDRHKMPGELSGGMKKRVGLARALVLEPSVLLYDEPTTGLDPIMTKHIDEMILRTRDQFDVTSVVVSHDLKSVSRIADQVTFLHGGVALVFDSYTAFAASPDPTVREFVEAFTG